MLTLEQLKDLALLQTHRVTMLEIALARSENVCEQLAKQNEELRSQLHYETPKDGPVPDSAPLVATPEGDQGPEIITFPVMPLPALCRDGADK